MGRLSLKRWQYRSALFKAGFCGVLLAAVLCCVGLLAPAWQNTGGLWIYSTLTEPVPAWFQAVRVLEVLCVALILVSIATETIQDACVRGTPATDNAAVELTAAIAGVCGLAGVVVFAVAVHQYPAGQGPYGPCRVSLFWAWGLLAVGALLAVFSAALVSRSRRTHRQNTARHMQVAMFRKTAHVSLNPYFVCRSVPPVKILTPTFPAEHSDSHV